MKKEEQLHHLVKALSPAEKKYVRLNINKFRPEEESKNLLLFDTLNKQKKYDPEGSSKAYGQAGYTSSYLAADRHLLYDIVLDSLIDFHQKTTVDVQINNGFQKVVLLFEKKLFDQSLKQIGRVEKVALEFESYGTLLNLYNLKRRILKITNKVDEAILAIKKQSEFWEAQQKINEYIELHYESIKLRVAYSKVRSKENLEKIDAFIQHPLLKAELPKNSFQQQFHYWETYCNYYFILDKKEKELEANQALITLIEKNAKFKKNEPLNYLVFYTRMLAIQRNLFPKQFLENLKAYRALNKGFTKQKQQAESIIFIFSYNYELDYYIQHKDWDAGLELLPKMLKGLKKYNAFIRDPLKITAYYRIAYLNFFHQKYFEALDALEVILEDYSPTLRPDVYSFSLIIKIITHFEIGNIRLMPYLIKTAEYHITKRNLMFQTEKIAIQYLKKLSKKSNEGKHEFILEGLRETIEKLISENEYERRSLEFFDFLTWINSRKSVKKT